MRPNLFRSLGHGHSPVFIANRADPGARAGGRGRSVHPWRMVHIGTLHFDQLRLSVGGQMAQAHGTYPDRALSDSRAAGQNRLPARPVHTPSPNRGFPEGGLCHRRIPKRSSNGHHRIIPDTRRVSVPFGWLFQFGDPAFQSRAGSVRSGLTSRPFPPAGSFFAATRFG